MKAKTKDQKNPGYRAREIFTEIAKSIFEKSEELQERPVKEIESILEKTISKKFVELYKELGTLEGVIITQTLEEQIKKRWVPHNIGVLAATLQLKNARFSPDPKKQIRLQRLSLNDSDGKRTNENLKKIRAAINGNLKKWISISLAHDLGRITETPEKSHEFEGCRLVKNYSLLENLGLSGSERKLIPLVVKYHVYPSLSLNGEFPATKLQDILNDKEARSFGEGEVMRDTSILWLFDVAGTTPEGLLNNVRAEYALGIAELLEKHAASGKNTTKYLTELSKEFLPIRISGLISFNDRLQSKHIKNGAPKPENYRFYWDKFVEAKTQAKISEENWRFFLENFHRITLRYINYNFSKISWTDNDVHRLSEAKQNEQFIREREVKSNYKLSPNIVKFLVLVTGLLKEIPNKKVEIIVGDSNGRQVDKKGIKVDDTNDHTYALQMNRIFFLAEGLQKKDNE